MNIFNKRPLGLILCVILSGFSIFVLLTPLMRSIAVIFALSLIIIAFATKRYGVLLKIVSVSLLLSFLASFLYFDVSFYPDDLYESKAEFVAKVTDCEVKSEYYQSAEVETLTVNSNNRTIKIKLNVYGYHEKIKPGSIITFDAKLNELNDSESFDFKKYYTSRGISATADITDFEIKSYDKEPLSYKFKMMRESISKRAEALSNEKAGSMLSALLLGERERLSGQVSLDFGRIGITHILALSGTHVVILAAAVDRILSLFRVKRKYRLIFGAVFTLLFMALTGFPLSVCRAGIMLIISTILFLITGCKDSVTSLFMASALIIIHSPYASQDVGLWLSILATGGILVAAEMFNERYSDTKGIKRFGRYVLLSFTFSLFAISATVIVSTLSFTGTSALSALTTFIFSILTELYVYLGIVVLLIGELLPIGKLLILFENSMSNLAGLFSDISFAYSSTEFSSVKILFIILGISFITFAITSIKNRKAFITCLSILFVVANVLPIGLTARVKSRDMFAVVNDVHDKIIIRADGESLLFDISNSSQDTAYSNNSLLIEERMAELDYYVVANYYEHLPNSLDKVLSSNYIKEIKLPKPSSYEEHEIAKDVMRTMEDYRAKLSFYDDISGIWLSEFEIIVPYREENMLAVLFRKGDEIYTYISKGLIENVSEAESLLFVSDYIIFGGYGKAYSKLLNIDEFDKRLNTVVSFDERVNIDTSYSSWQPPKLYFVDYKFYFYK